jgi:hypothetical protein
VTLAAAAILALGIGPAAYVEGEGGTAAGALWQASNGNRTVSATQWFAANRAQQVALSHQYPDQPPAREYAAQTPSRRKG